MPRVPPKGRRWAKGQSGNPGGSSAKSRAEGAIRRLTAEQVAHLTSDILMSRPDALQRAIKDREGNVLQFITSVLLATAVKKGDVSIYRAVLDRAVGRPKETVTLGGDANNPLVSRNETKEEKIARIERLRRAREVVDG